MKNKKSPSLIASFQFAMKGIVSFIQSSRNAKIHLVVAAMVIIFGFLFKVHVAEWILLILCISAVISLEMINSSIEMLADKVEPEKDTVIGKLKDIAAGAVLISAIASAIIGLMIFLPKVL